MDIDLNQVRDYLSKSGDKELPDGTLERTDTGFCIWRIENKSLILAAVYGDGTHWNAWATEKAMNENLQNIIFATRRHPGGFMRKHGFEITGYIMSRSV